MHTRCKIHKQLQLPLFTIYCSFPFILRYFTSLILMTLLCYCLILLQHESMKILCHGVACIILAQLSRIPLPNGLYFLYSFQIDRISRSQKFIEAINPRDIIQKAETKTDFGETLINLNQSKIVDRLDDRSFDTILKAVGLGPVLLQWTVTPALNDNKGQ